MTSGSARCLWFSSHVRGTRSRRWTHASDAGTFRPATAKNRWDVERTIVFGAGPNAAAGRRAQKAALTRPPHTIPLWPSRWSGMEAAHSRAHAGDSGACARRRPVPGRDAEACRWAGGGGWGGRAAQSTAQMRPGLGAGAGSSSSNPVRASTWRRMVSNRCSTFSDVRADVSTSLHPMSAASSRPSASDTCWALRLAARQQGKARGERRLARLAQRIETHARQLRRSPVTPPLPGRAPHSPRNTPPSHPSADASAEPGSRNPGGGRRACDRGPKQQLTSLAEDRSCSRPPRGEQRRLRWLQATCR